MTLEVTQYYNSLLDKEKDGVKYFFDITAVNKATGINYTVVSVQQNMNKAKGAERFKEVAERMERQRYDMLLVKEYGMDGTTVINDIKLPLRRKSGNNGKSQGRNLPSTGQDSSLGGFEQQLTRFGFENGLMGILDATAEKRTNDYIMDQQKQQIQELKTQLALSDQEKIQLKRDVETYKERYKDILDERKEMERDHKHEIKELQQKNSLGALAIQGAMGLLAKNPIVAGLLGAVMPQGAQTAQPDSDNDDDDDIVINQTDPEKQRYLDIVSQYTQQIDTAALKEFCAIIQYLAMGNLAEVVTYCRNQYQQKQKTN